MIAWAKSKETTPLSPPATALRRSQKKAMGEADPPSLDYADLLCQAVNELGDEITSP